VKSRLWRVGELRLKNKDTQHVPNENSSRATGEWIWKQPTPTNTRPFSGKKWLSHKAVRENNEYSAWIKYYRNIQMSTWATLVRALEPTSHGDPAPLTLREMVFCRTSNRNCSCRREAVSAGWEGNARKPCCRLLDSKYCSNSRVSCCKQAAGKVSVLVPSSTKSPGGSGEKSHFGRQIITSGILKSRNHVV